MSDLKNRQQAPVSRAEAPDVVGIPTHPIATAAGALIFGAASGAVAGTAGGPLGTVIGAVVGAVVGGLGMDAVAASIEETPHTDYWRRNYTARPYVEQGASFDDFGPAYNYDYGARVRFEDISFEEAEPALARDWAQARGGSSLAWELARNPVRDAWDRHAMGSASTA